MLAAIQAVVREAMTATPDASPRHIKPAQTEEEQSYESVESAKLPRSDQPCKGP